MSAVAERPEQAADSDGVAHFGEGLTGQVVFALALIMTLIAILWNADAFPLLGFAFLQEQFYALELGLALAAVFLSWRLDRSRTGQAPWYDWALAAAALMLFFWLAWDFDGLKSREFANSTIFGAVMGGVIALFVIEALRRTAGYVILAVVLVFLLYAPFAWLVPGPLAGPKVEIWNIASNLGFNPNAIFGIPLDVGTSVALTFILFGQVLFRAGGGQFFTDLAMSSVGRRRGGAAKISIVASALFGTISGTAVSNVVTTGIITIPLMRKAGYKPTDAGAIEAIASTGGQLMPPVMGIAAFLMAEFLDIPYADVALAALVPALLYYFAVFIQVDLIAARDNLSFVDVDRPSAMKVLAEGWHFIIPFAFLIFSLFWLNMGPSEAALGAALIVAVLGMIFSGGGERLRLSEIPGILASTGMVVIELLMIVAGAGIVIGILNLTSLGFSISLFLVSLGGGQLWLVLLITAAVSIVLGMGMPTAVVYILLATMIAPAVIEAGVSPMQAHLFILYFGMMSMITPPVALAAFTAATLTKAGPMATAFAAMRLGWVAYIVPFLFVMSPSLVLDGKPLTMVFDLTTACVGVFVVSVAGIGYFTRPIPWFMRIFLMVCGLVGMLPVAFGKWGAYAGAIALAIAVTWLVWERALARRKAVA